MNCNEKDLACFGLSESILENRKLSKDKDEIWRNRQEEVIKAFQHAWKGYQENAFGYDEYYPNLKKGKNFIEGGLGFTIIDSLDTIILMGLKEEYEKSIEWINELNFDRDEYVNLFETNIRVLGGLLSSYFLTGSNNELLLNKSVDLADRLIKAFNTESKIPEPTINLKTGLHKNEIYCSTAEATTLQLEMKYLSYLTNNYSYWNISDNVIDIIDDQYKLDGLVPIFIDVTNGKLHGDEVRLGSRGDSYYEYLLKLWLQSGKTEAKYKRMYDEAIEGIKKHLIAYSLPKQYLVLGEIDLKQPNEIIPKMDHLVCFMAGSFALGATEGKNTLSVNNLSKWDLNNLELGKELMETCYLMYKIHPTGLAAEITMFNIKDHTSINGNNKNNDAYVKTLDRHNLLRPEAVESLFILYRITKDNKYREYGWEMFNNFIKYCKVENGFISLKDVTTIPPILGDKMETFFLAETLKYFYLLFSNDKFLPLDKLVFNTEAHPLPLFIPK
ncbi:glycoside hydrolase [Neoconidiobolus thromboides FSU 785]|nr:glycoside hydrolase [Neoconidiobolus thromboides FSU 785]